MIWVLSFYSISNIYISALIDMEMGFNSSKLLLIVIFIRYILLYNYSTQFIHVAYIKCCIYDFIHKHFTILQLTQVREEKEKVCFNALLVVISLLISASVLFTNYNIAQLGMIWNYVHIQLHYNVYFQLTKHFHTFYLQIKFKY